MVLHYIFINRAHIINDVSLMIGLSKAAITTAAEVVPL
jgi:hypothetical protein